MGCERREMMHVDVDEKHGMDMHLPWARRGSESRRESQRGKDRQGERERERFDTPHFCFPFPRPSLLISLFAPCFSCFYLFREIP